jgi:hypothetical protein
MPAANGRESSRRIGIQSKGAQHGTSVAACESGKGIRKGYIPRKRNPISLFTVEISRDVLSLPLVATKNQSSSQEHTREKEKDRRQAEGRV